MADGVQTHTVDIHLMLLPDQCDGRIVMLLAKETMVRHKWKTFHLRILMSFSIETEEKDSQANLRSLGLC